MPNMLLWLACPLVFVPLLAVRDRSRGAAGQLILAGLGLAALQRGVGTLDPQDLRDIVGQSPHDAWFVGVTIGALISGACLLPDIRNWRKLVVALPLLAGLTFATSGADAVAVLVGAVIGSLPTLLGRLIGSTRRLPTPMSATSTPPPGIPKSSVLLAAATIGAALVAPMLLAAVGLDALSWRQWWLCRRERPSSWMMPALPILATILLAVWLWLALTIAGSPFVGLRAFGVEAPVSTAAGTWLALLAIGWGIALAAPWPIDRLADATVQLPALAVVLYLALARGTTDGMVHWQPLLSCLMVLLAVVAVGIRRWDGAAAALVLLAATRTGGGSLAAALLLAVVPAGRRRVRSPRVGGAIGGAALALAVASVLRDEVLLAVVLAFSLATLANRRDDIVAPG